MPPEGINQLGLHRRGCILPPLQARPSATSQCTKSVLSEGDTLRLQERRLSLEQLLSSPSTQMLQVLVSTALPPNAVTLHLFGTEHQCLF